jgi:hypothetical protein
MIKNVLIDIFRYDIHTPDFSYEQAYPGDESDGNYVTNRTNINELVSLIFKYYFMPRPQWGNDWGHLGLAHWVGSTRS